jgi:hypothetical protein
MFKIKAQFISIQARRKSPIPVKVYIDKFVDDYLKYLEGKRQTFFFFSLFFFFFFFFFLKKKLIHKMFGILYFLVWEKYKKSSLTNS